MSKTKNVTTLSIPDEVTREARKRAIDEGTSMSAVVTTLLRLWLAKSIELPKLKVEKAQREDKRKKEDKSTK